MPEYDEQFMNMDDADPSVPTELLELHVDLEEAEVSSEEFKKAFKK